MIDEKRLASLERILNEFGGISFEWTKELITALREERKRVKQLEDVLRSIEYYTANQTPGLQNVTPLVAIHNTARQALANDEGK